MKQTMTPGSSRYLVPAEGLAGIWGTMAFLTSQEVVRALLEEEAGEEASQSTVEENRDIQ